jgi:release factor glutamine methyltransferase
VTLGEALHEATQKLEQTRVPSPRLTAEVLLAHACGTDRAFLYAHRDDSLDAGFENSYRSMIDRRSHGEPLQYITGIQEFFGRTFEVNPSVLIPRPETEFVVEAALSLSTGPTPRILDVGTGSGCIAITLALELPHATVWASDISFEAVQTARKNARRMGAAVRLACMPSLTGWTGPFDVIASNPPYVASGDREGLQREVRGFEPAVALFGDGDPIDFYRRILGESFERLVAGGFLVVEIGYSMEEAVRALFPKRWELFPTRCDLQGIPRVIVARKR